MDNNKPDLMKENMINDELIQKELEEPTYWRSFRELYNDPSFQEIRKKEFPDEAFQNIDSTSLSLITRRKFLALMSTSAALAAAGCSDYHEKGEIVPYNKKPEEIILGIPNYYASTCTACNNVCGILIKTREGRPIKIDGNDEHLVSRGKICNMGQANILNLYDPGRLKEPLFSSNKSNPQPISWQQADDKIISELKTASVSGKEISILTHKILSPTLKNLLDEFKSVYPTTKIYSYEISNDSDKVTAWLKSYGQNTLPVIQWDKAKVIVALEFDLLGNEGNVIEQTRQYTSKRDTKKPNEFNRLYAVEGAVSLTGLNADYRIRLRTDAIEEFILSLLNEIIINKKISSFSNDSKVTDLLKNYQLSDFIKKNSLNEKYVNQLVSDLVKNQNNSIVIAGSSLPESTHIAVNFLNEVLGNTRLYSDNAETELLPLSSNEDIEQLINSMNQGKTSVLINFDTNPVFDLAYDYGFENALKNIPTVITLNENVNESSEVSNYTLPLNHCFESWGDYKTRNGFYSLQQPVIAPLYQTRQKEAILLTWLRGNKDAFHEGLYHEYLMSNWQKNIYSRANTLVDFTKYWYSSLHDGVAFIKEQNLSQTSFNTEAFLSNSGKLKAGIDFVLLLRNNYSIGIDGKYANNGWMQELPHPVSKIVWDNYAAVSVQTASELGVRTYDQIEIQVNGKKQILPVFIQPGLADKQIEIALGYGRKNAGVIGSNIGINVNSFITKNPAITPFLYNNISVSKAAGVHDLVSTEEHHPIDMNPVLKTEELHLQRGIVQEGTLEEFIRNPKFIKDKHHIKLFSISKEHKYTGVKWGMSVDLNKCTGCEVCITACNVENNIPVVGKDQVKANREMHWIRIDRYYSDSPDNPKASFQPMLCQQCDNAPCENVCPVAATNHSPDGLNQMTYNRCVGTRYCSNNCPYKVRRFNFFDFRQHLADNYYYSESVNLLYNPEVTVRSRGVMEKCTFCLQKIMDERQNSIQENRPINGDNVITACQQSCPANAIEFGDTSNIDSKIYKQLENVLGYSVLQDINVRPNVTYIAKLRNNSEKL